MLRSADGATKKIFQNGVEVASTACSTDTPELLTRSLANIGAQDAKNFHEGTIAYVRIYQGPEPDEGWASAVSTRFANKDA